MASSGSGAHDDSFYPSSGGTTGASAPSGELRVASSQTSNTNFPNSGERSVKDSSHHHSGERSVKDSSHHQVSSREGGRRER